MGERETVSMALALARVRESLSADMAA